MSHQNALILLLTLIISTISTLAVAKTSCRDCGIDGKEINDIRMTDFKPNQKVYYPSSISGGRLIDFESFEDYQNINGINLGGVTLTNPVNGLVEIFDNRCGAAYHSPTKTISGNECSCKTPDPIVGIFDYSATYIGLWAGDGGEDNDSWELEAFDAPIGGNSLGIVTSGDWNGYPYRKLEIIAPVIWRFEARWTGAACGVDYDDLDVFIPLLSLGKNDDVNDGDCVVPGREITYTITYNPNIRDNNFIIIDYLPVEVDYNSSSHEGDYNAVERTITWDIETIPPDANGILTLSVYVNKIAEPCTVFANICELKDENDLTYNIAEVNTPVCLWSPEVIYVDCNRANGRNNGMRWDDAYLDLQDALDRASWGGGYEIWVAAGTYKPSIKDPCYPNYGLTFKLIDGVSVHGHFVGGETSLEQRDLNDPNNETILSGAGVSSNFIITASGLNQNNTLDGFTIIGPYSSNGVRIVNAYLAVSNCLITGDENSGNGINAVNSYFIVTNSVVQNSEYDGVFADFANNSSLQETQIENCIFRNNRDYGIRLNQSVLPVVIENCIIYNNKMGIFVNSCPPIINSCKIFENREVGIQLNNATGYIIDNWIYRNTQRGIFLNNSPGPTTIRNNTIALNNFYGIHRNSGTAPIISNSIVWSNTLGDLYNCSGNYLWLTANGDPCFIASDINDFHLKPDSNCIDVGDPCFMDFNETDVDGECRILFGKSAIRVDIGADELDWPKADFDRDEIVNFIDYVLWSPSWKTIDPNKSLDTDNDVDIDDLAEFCNYWLWEAPW